MATGKLIPTRSGNLLTTNQFDSITSGNYAIGPAIDLTNNPLEAALELNITPGTVSGDKIVYVYLKASVVNSSSGFTSGPESGTSTINEANLYYLGPLYCNTNSQLSSYIFSIKQAIGFIPLWYKPIIKNSTGATLGTGNTAHSITWLADIV